MKIESQRQKLLYKQHSLYTFPVGLLCKEYGTRAGRSLVSLGSTRLLNFANSFSQLYRIIFF